MAKKTTNIKEQFGPVEQEPVEQLAMQTVENAANETFTDYGTPKPKKGRPKKQPGDKTPRATFICPPDLWDSFTAYAEAMGVTATSLLISHIKDVVNSNQERITEYREGKERLRQEFLKMGE